MDFRRLWRIAPLVVAALVSVWLIAQPATPAPVASPRTQGLRQSLSPAGSQAAAVVSSVQGELETIYPTTVNLADVPVGEYTPYNTYDQWRAGVIDFEENNEGRRSQLEVQQLQAEAMALPPSRNIQVIGDGPGGWAPTPLTSFDAINVAECCGGGTSVPPDSDMAAGPNHLIAVANVAFKIYNKAGAVLAGPTTFASFFASQAVCVAGPYGAFDPTVLYDEEADRFIIGVDGNGTHFCAAVSATNNPLGAWYVYAAPANFSGAFHDYPHTGVGDDAIFVGANQFGGGLPGGFEGRVWALNKTVMYAGQALTPVTFSTGSTEGTPQPLHLHGYLQGTWPNSTTHYFATDPYDGCTLNIWRWLNPLTGGVPSIVSTFNLCTATGVPGGMPVDAPQQGGTPIQANDWRTRGFEYRNGYGWTADSISCNPGGGTVDCVRFTQVNLTANPPTLTQAGVFASSGVYRTFPDLVVNDCDDMAVGYSQLSSTTWPSIYVTGRLSTDPPGTVQPQVLLKAGEKVYTSFDTPPYRWGDYSGMTIDPDGVTFWHMGEYSKIVPAGPAANWGNYIGSYTYTSCGGAQNQPPTADAGGPYSVAEGSSVQLNGAGSDPDNDPLTFAWDLDNNGSFETPGQSVAFSAATLDGPASRTVVLQVCDDQSACATDPATVNVSNVPPTVNAGPDQVAGVGQVVNLAPATFTDPGLADTHTATIDWGDGTVVPGTVNQAAKTVSGSHSYANFGAYTVTVCVTDDDTGAGCDTMTVSVNSPPVAVDDMAVSYGWHIFIDVLANDSDPDGDPLAVASVTQPQNGRTANYATRILYMPQRGFKGTDSFSYTITDGNGGVSTANVTVMVY